MHSIRTKITLLTVSAIVVVISLTTAISSISIRNLGKRTSDQILYLMCEEGEKNLDTYFTSIEHVVETISSYAEADLERPDFDSLSAHIDRVEDIFGKSANNSNGILTYYYRIDPKVSEEDKGFWYVDLDGNGFQEHKVTDITLYDTNDQTNLVWFTVPKATGDSVWLPPYFTDNLDVYVLSYNVPIHKGNRFIGVIGIEIDYNTIVAPVKDISLYKNGYAFINDAEGTIIYHPRMDISDYTGGAQIKVPDGLLSDDNYIKYSYNNIEKQAVWLPLSNGMRLNVTVPVKEINEGWRNLVRELIIISLILLFIFIILTMRFAQHIANPLQELTKAASEMNNGNYDFTLDYNKNDEVGALTKTFSQLVSHLKVYIKDLNDLAYSDPLTSVHNKGAFDIYVRDIQTHVDNSMLNPEFAIGIFDCNNLKEINDNFGHKSGDLYLKASVSLICKVFQHSPVFRLGGDEFAVILKDEDYENRASLTKLFADRMAEISASANSPNEQISIAMGVAVYDPETDNSVDNVIRRADKLMYKDKYTQKSV